VEKRGDELGAMSELLGCIQLEFARPLGPSEGRYVVSDPGLSAEGADVLDVRAVAARVLSESRGALGRRSRGEAKALSLVRYTLIRASRPLAGDSAARAWLARLSADAGARERETHRALAVLNAAIRAYRVAAADPYAIEVSQSDAHAVRFGAGTRRQAFDGEGVMWISAPGGGRAADGGSGARLGPDRLEPTRAVASALAGRSAPTVAEDLVLRTLLELRLGDPIAAAAVLRGALELIAADPTRHSSIDDALLQLARQAADAALTRARDACADSAPLSALAVQLREQLRAAAVEELDAVANAAEPPDIEERREFMSASSDGTRSAGVTS
jgi:hypothetical protein